MNTRDLIESDFVPLDYEEERHGVEDVELVNGEVVQVSLHGHSVKLGGKWYPFDTPEDMFEWLSHHTVDSERWAVANHVQRDTQSETPEVPMERKRELMVWEDDTWLILKMPADVDFIHREGIDMQHCLGHRGTAEQYCQQMQGEQDQYSLVKKEDGKPYVNFEVALTRSSYGGPVDSPTVTQIRGRRNQCPPADEYIVPLKKFFDANPDWTVSGHGVRSFDGGVDGDKFAARVAQMDASLFESAHLDYGGDELNYYCLGGTDIIADIHTILDGIKQHGSKYEAFNSGDTHSALIKTTLQPEQFEKLVPERYEKYELFEGLVVPSRLVPDGIEGWEEEEDGSYYWYQALTEEEHFHDSAKADLDRGFNAVIDTQDGIAESREDKCPMCGHTAKLVRGLWECNCKCPDCGRPLTRSYEIGGYFEGDPAFTDESGRSFELICLTRVEQDWAPECEYCQEHGEDEDWDDSQCSCDDRPTCAGPIGTWQDAGGGGSSQAEADKWKTALKQQSMKRPDHILHYDAED